MPDLLKNLKIMRVHLVSIVLLSGFVMFFSNAEVPTLASTSMPSSLSTYNDASYGITMDYPSNWQVMDTSSEMKKNLGGAPTLLLHKTFVQDANIPTAGFIALGVVQGPPGLTLDQLMTNGIQAFKNNPQLLQIDEPSVVKAQLAGQPAYQYTYTSNMPLLGQPLGKVMQIDTVIGGKNYAIAFKPDNAEKDPSYQAVIQKMISSLQIRPTSSSLAEPVVTLLQRRLSMGLIF